MVYVILDTNIYGNLLADGADGRELGRKIAEDDRFVIRNFRLIRNELRGAPKTLPLYDSLVARRVIDETKEIKELAKAYFEEYKANGGRQGKKKMMNDFKIVACASLTNCDLVVSDDKKTLKHPVAVQAYKIVNLKRNMRPLAFLSYTDLKARYL